MKSAINKNNSREIKKSIGRYIAIAAIICLGVGFFSGLSVTRESMLDTANTYTNDTKMYDYKLISTLGLTPDDIAAFYEIDGVVAAEGSYTIDFMCENGTSEYVLTANSLGTTVNIPHIEYGRLPVKGNECLADSLGFDENDIGMVIRISDGNDEDTFDKFAYDEYTIVGIVNSPLYMNRIRPSSKLGSGTSSGYILIPEDGFTLDYYTEAYVALSQNEYIFTDEYESLIDSHTDAVSAMLEDRADIRYTDLYNEAYNEITDAEAEYNSALSELADAKTELEERRIELADAEREYDEGVKLIADAEAEIAKAKDELDAAEEEYAANLEDYNQAYEEAYAMIDAYKAELDSLQAMIGSTTDPMQLAQLEYGLADYEASRAAADAEFAAAKAELDGAARQFEEARTEISEKEEEIEDNRQKLNEALVEIEDGKLKLADGEVEINDASAELEEARIEIDDAYAQLADLDKPSVFTLTREENSGYANLQNDSAIVEGIAKVFPVFFFAVAALVCSTTMARMVSDERTEIGTLKALGYSDGKVMWKYIMYSGSAAMLGGIIGFLAGSKLFPLAIWTAYKMLYCFSETINFVFDVPLAIVSLGAALLCSVGSTFWSVKSELLEMPSALIRPRAPQAGKRILIERIPWLWKRFKFLHKVSLRNIFRYKKRLFMMILGIGGCTALVLTGFGIGDSIKNIISFQYDEIMKYDYALTLAEPADTEFVSKFQESTNELLETSVFLNTTTADLHTKNGVKSLTLTVTDDKNIEKLIDLHMDETQIAYPSAGYAVINEKLAYTSGYSIGDIVEIYLSETEVITAEISGICENYVFNLICITSETYIDSLDREPELKTIYARKNSSMQNSRDVHEISAELMSMEGIANVQVVEDTKNMVSDMMQSMDFVVLLVIACAAALAFVVLYNLSNINITERTREIATLKVLGFYPVEVSSYVFRENLVLTFIGAMIGLPAGVLLHRFVMSQINIDMVSFDVRIIPSSYIFAFGLTIIFTVAVDLFMRIKLNRINMAESLKSIE